MTNDTNAANNSIPIVETDPKQLFDDYSSTARPPQGFHPNGIDNNNGSIFYPILAYDTDVESLETLAGDNEGIELGTNLNTGPLAPASELPPKMGKRLYQSSNRNTMPSQ